MVYDVDLNSDIFYRECPDGVFSCRFCTLQGCEQPLAVVGGNCSVVGFGWQGTELFWNVAGDDVRVVAPCEGDLLVGPTTTRSESSARRSPFTKSRKRTRSWRCVRWEKRTVCVWPSERDCWRIQE